MRKTNEVVKKNDGREWPFTMVRPENLDEAKDLYGEQAVFDLFDSGLKVRLQGVAREMFDDGKEQEEVEEAIRNYKPGTGQKKSMKSTAIDLLTDKAYVLQENEELKTEVRQLFTQGKFKEVVEKLETL